jgi:hypothetical protein
MYDLKLFPIHHHQGKPIPQQAGFLAASPPRRAVRSRSEDLLIVSLTTNGGDQIAPEQLDTWLTQLVNSFYKTSGSVTSALRTLIETLNLTMMEKNLKSAKQGSAVTGAINLAAVHRRVVYLTQSGLTHAYTLTQGGLQHFSDSSRTDRGLGLSRTPTIRYYQADLGDGGYLFMTNTPAETWTDDQLCLGGFPNLEQLRRRLLNQASPNVRLDLVQVLPGDGQITTVKRPEPEPEKAQQGEAPPLEIEETPAPLLGIEPEVVTPEVELSETQKLPQDPDDIEAVEAEPEGIPEASPLQESKPEQELVTALPDVEEGDEPLSAQKDEGSETKAPDAVLEAKSNPKEPKAKKPRIQRRSFAENFDSFRSRVLQSLASFFDWWRKARGNLGTFFQDFISRVGFKGGEGLSSLSSQTLLMIAVVVPLAVVAIAVGVYLSRGRAIQYQYYLEQAELASQNASTADDPKVAREGWSQTLLFLDQAESYRRSDEISELRINVQRALDRLDGAVRLTYHPAIIGTLFDEIYITRIISYGLDLYMLDEVDGRVIHATRSSQGYQVDPEFICNAGNFSGGRIDSLVDMIALPINNPYQAHILGADAIGNVVYCGPGQDPVVQTLPAGEGTVGAVKRITAEGNLLYVLDPTGDSVRIYRSTNGQFLDPPSDFFEGATDGQKPSLASIVDLAVNGTELYLLRMDGGLVSCILSGLPSNPVNCENPVTYVDGRPGYEDQVVVMPDSRFVSILYTAPPDPAVSILDADNADIFRFSLRFRLYQRLRSEFGEYEITTPTATAFTIGVDRIAYIAFGHQVFYAYVE